MTNRRRVSDNNNISQLLRDSFSAPQQPPIWEPPSHYSMISGFTFHLSKSIIFRRYLSFVLSLKYLLSDRTAVSSDKILTRLRKPTFLLMELQLKIREADWHRQKVSADEWNRMKNLQRHECTMCNSLIITLRKS